jgi:hypothetical protein
MVKMVVFLPMVPRDPGSNPGIYFKKSEWQTWSVGLYKNLMQNLIVKCLPLSLNSIMLQTAGIQKQD